MTGAAAAAPKLGPLGWGHRDPEREQRVRRQAGPIIARVLKQYAGTAGIAVHLALGAACPFTSLADKKIWLEEIRKQESA